MPYLTQLSLFIVGVLHLLPLAGAWGGPQLYSLYGLDFSDPNALILMRHRAILFGLLGALALVAIVMQQLQVAALAMAWVSVVSFLWLASGAATLNPQLLRVARVDWLALASLALGTAAYVGTWLQKPSPNPL